MFQFIAFFGWERAINNPGFWSYLLALATLAYALVQEPLRSAENSKREQALGGLGIITIAGLVATLTAVGRASLEPEASFVPSISSLGTQLANLQQCSTLSRTKSYVINPSVAWIAEREELWMAARMHRYVAATASSPVVTWASEVLLGRLDPVTFEPLGPISCPLQGSTGNWESCPDANSATFANGTLRQLHAVGFEDPRLLVPPGGDGLGLSSVLAAPVPGGRRCVLSSRVLGHSLQGPNLTEQATALLHPPAFDSTDLSEKNWLAFYGLDGRLRYVRNVAPFEVVRADATQPARFDAARGVVMRTEPLQLDDELLSALAVAGIAIHGGANPILLSLAADNTTLGPAMTLNASKGTRGQHRPASSRTWPYNPRKPYVGKRDVFVGIFHSLSASGEYQGAGALCLTNS